MNKIRLGIKLFLLTLISCNTKTDTPNDVDKLHSYLGVNLFKISDIHIFEYTRMEDYDYPKSVFISFSCEKPKIMIGQLDLIPAKSSLNKDTSRIEDYKYAKYTSNFWKMSSTITSTDIIDIEKKKLKWWHPINDTSVMNYGGFYNEFGKKKIVKTRDRNWTGRLVFQNIGNKVYIQIDLLVGNSKTSKSKAHP